MECKVGPCPLGSKCIDIQDNVQYFCPWYIKMRGKNPQSDQEVDEYRCAIGWLPILMVEHSLFERQTGAAVESLRNAVITKNTQIAEEIKERLSHG